MTEPAPAIADIATKADESWPDDESGEESFVDLFHMDWRRSWQSSFAEPDFSWRGIYLAESTDWESFRPDLTFANRDLVFISDSCGNLCGPEQRSRARKSKF